jgi:hypothetical protein
MASMPERLFVGRAVERLLFELVRERFPLRERFREAVGIVGPPVVKKMALIPVCEGGIRRSSLI